MQDDVDSIFDLRDEFDRRSQAFETAAAASATQATDPSDAFVVDFDPVSRALTLTLRDSWRTAYSGAELGGAIVSAVAALAAERMRAWGADVAESDERPAPVTRPTAPSDETPAARLRATLEGVDDTDRVRDMMGEMLAMFDEVNAGLEATMELISARASATHSGVSAARHVTVALDGSGGITSIVYADSWIATARTADVERETNEALAAAGRAAAAAITADVLAGTPLARYSGLLTDPDGLSRLITGKD